MKLNLKSTIAAPADQTLNGIIGNTRRGIQVDQALDPDSNNPVANKPVSTALAALADQLGGKQDKLTAGNNITIEGTTISAAGGKSVPPTLNLVDFELGEVRDTITEEEYNNLKNGLYNQVIYGDEENNVGIYMPSKLYDIGGFYQFSQFVANVTDGKSFTYSTIRIYSITFGEKNTSNEYPITIEKGLDINHASSGGDNTIPTLETKRSYIGDDNTVYSDADIELIKKQENNFINVPIGESQNITNTLCFVVKAADNKNYVLYAVGGIGPVLLSALSSAPVALLWNVNITIKKLTTQQFTGLSQKDTSLYVRDGKIFLTDTLTTQDPVNVLHNSYTFDKINGKPIIHSDSAVNSYNIPTITFED